MNLKKLKMENFVDKQSIVRKIWGKGDNILLIFAGAAAEFALSKAVDWLYFTGKLPADPLGRLFTTVSYARAIVFSDKRKAFSAIDAMTAIHADVEAKRGTKIPDWAFRDVLFMLIDYSIRSFEVLERRLSEKEKEDVFEVFQKLGSHMHIKGLPENFKNWEVMRQEHLQQNLKYSHYTQDLFKQYRHHIGDLRFRLLVEAQIMVTPQKVRDLLGYRKYSMLHPLLVLYKLSRSIGMEQLLRNSILPDRYKKEIMALDRISTSVK